MKNVSMRKIVSAAAVAIGLGVAALGGGGLFGAESGGSPAPTSVEANASQSVATSTVATARKASLAVFDAPDGAPAELSPLPNPRPSGAPLVLLVVEDRPGWLQVQLPERPNGSTGWVRAGEVTTSSHQFRIEVSLGGHVLTAFDGDQRILETPVAVGAEMTPTPTGHFYTTELLRPTNPRGAYGPYAFGLSAHSDVLTDFAGGDGTVGIHGTNDPSSLGTDASHGCVRIDNEAITFLAESVPAGTPVDIVA
ncbi:MAG TPA: L,D-transpeptidase [Acidimicrobiales bacterium]|nr:L,D-transpeptidase [Acidimicrobiales bacterium]